MNVAGSPIVTVASIHHEVQIRRHGGGRGTARRGPAQSRRLRVRRTLPDTASPMCWTGGELCLRHCPRTILSSTATSARRSSSSVLFLRMNGQQLQAEPAEAGGGVPSSCRRASSPRRSSRSGSGGMPARRRRSSSRRSRISSDAEADAKRRRKRRSTRRDARRSDCPADHPPVTAGQIGVLLVNLGTPEGTELLADAAVSERVPVRPPRDRNGRRSSGSRSCKGSCSPVRPKKSGALYASIWNKERNESPLRTFTRAQGREARRRTCRRRRGSSSTGRCATASRRSPRGSMRSRRRARSACSSSRSIRNTARRRRRPSTTTPSMR